MNKFFTAVLTLAVLALAIPAGADECVPSTSTPEADTGETPTGQFYVDVDFPADGVWIYQESNGIAGLQRGDSLKDDTCGGLIDADTVIF